MPKLEFNHLLNGSAVMVDMESCFAAEFALQRQIPFLCFRAISDALYDEIDFDPGAIIDAHGRVKILKVLSAILQKPQLLGSFYQAWRRSDEASKNLCNALARFLELPSQSLRQMTERSVLKSISRT